MVAGLDGLRERIGETSEASIRELATLNASHFAAYADIAGLVGDAASDPWCRNGAPPTKRSLAASPAAPRKAAVAQLGGVGFPPSRAAAHVSKGSLRTALLPSWEGACRFQGVAG